ncbi:hypothetical protein D3C87_2144720 [compost metagenome]
MIWKSVHNDQWPDIGADRALSTHIEIRENTPILVVCFRGRNARYHILQTANKIK